MPAKIARCAIYTRKSTEHNLDLEFNSLDAQREACEAYIKSQAHEGWRLVPDPYDDGGISGGSLDRPGLQALLSEIRAGKIDIIVVYKVDRLTRSLADFAKLVELFDQHGVSFVSITQSFNTTTSMGRLTLNVLLSFAQFEREVIGERVRDKISASKRKGIWVGGPVPLGYASVNKKIVIVPDEAETVRHIFRRYLYLGAVRALAADLDESGIRSKRRQLASGRSVGGGRFGVGALSHFLKNRFYVGEVSYRGEVHQAEHEPILARGLFEEVQITLSTNNVARSLKLKAQPSLLAGRIYDDRGNAMVPSHTNKKGVRYRYYVSSAVLQKRNGKMGKIRRLSASDIEQLVLDGLRTHFNKSDQPEVDDRALWPKLKRVAMTPTTIEICANNNESSAGIDDFISIPWSAPQFIALKGIIKTPKEEKCAVSAETREALLSAIAKARSWLDQLLNDCACIDEIAQREGKVARYIRLLLPLAFTPPQVVQSIIDGVATDHLTVTGLAKRVCFSWRQIDIL